MSYPKTANKQGPEKFTAPGGPDRNSMPADPLAGGLNPKADKQRPDRVPPSSRPSGRSDGQAEIAKGFDNLGTVGVPPVRDATSPGKITKA